MPRLASKRHQSRRGRLAPSNSVAHLISSVVQIAKLRWQVDKAVCSVSRENAALTQVKYSYVRLRLPEFPEKGRRVSRRQPLCGKPPRAILPRFDRTSACDGHSDTGS